MTSETLTPEQLEKEGLKAYQDEAYPEAARAFQAAAQGFAGRGETLKAAEVANNASVAFLQAGEAQAALDAVGSTAEQFAAAGDKKRQALALGNRAAALEALGQAAEAEALYQESAALLKELGETDLRASVLQSISRLQMRHGRYLEAVASMQSGLDQVARPSWRQRMVKKLLDIPFKMLNNRAGK